MLVASGGLYLARRGVLDASTRRKLSQITMHLTLPAYLFAQVAASVTAETIPVLWPLPVAAVLYVALGALAGKAVAAALRAPKHLAQVVVCACALGNSNNLPVVLSQAVVHMGADLLQVPGKPPRSEAELEGAAAAYVGAYLSVFSFLLWSIGPVLLMQDGSDTVPRQRRGGALEKEEAQLMRGEHDGDWRASASFTRKESDLELVSLVGQGAASDEEMPRGGRVSGTGDDSESQGAEGGGQAVEAASSQAPSSQVAPHGGPSAGRLGEVMRFLRRAITPPVVATLAGVVVGTTPLHAVLVADGAPLRVVYAALRTLGQAAIPISVVLLGANLSSGPDYAAIRPSLAVGIALTRMLLLPACALAVLSTVTRLGDIIPTDPMFRLVLLLEAACPTANNVVMIASMAQRNEAAVSTTLFTSYCIAPIVLSATISLFLMVVSHEEAGDDGGAEG